MLFHCLDFANVGFVTVFSFGGFVLRAHRRPVAAVARVEARASAGLAQSERRFRSVEGLVFEHRDVMAQPELPSNSADVVLCLSLTKWIHLHHGDEGIRRLFAHIRSTLRPGGLLFLEAQSFASYKKKKRKMTQAMKEMLQTIRLLPEEGFIPYLCDNLGFKLLEELNPKSESKGFQRPIWKLQKATE